MLQYVPDIPSDFLCWIAKERRFVLNTNRTGDNVLHHETMMEPEPPTTGATPESHRFFFILLDGFLLTAAANAMETLACANNILETPVFECKTCSQDGTDVMSSTGVKLASNAPLPMMHRADTIVLCGGPNIQVASTSHLTGWLRRQSVIGVRIVGLYTAAYTMAVSGLLDGRRATMHWDIRDSVQEEFPTIMLQDWMYVTDGKLCTTADSLSSIDLMLDIISNTSGAETANQTARKMNYANIHCHNQVAKITTSDVNWINHPQLKKAVTLMSQNLEAPLTSLQIAADIGISGRQLERLFRRFVGESPKKYYLGLRLQRAHNLLTQTSLSVIEIGMACGFGSPTNFSKVYRATYNTSPHRARSAFLATDGSTINQSRQNETTSQWSDNGVP